MRTPTSSSSTNSAHIKIIRSLLDRPAPAALLWSLIIIGLTLSPGNIIPKAPHWAELLSWDKLAHVILFMVEALLVSLTARIRFGIATPRSALIGFLAGIVFGGLIELAQAILPIGRSGNHVDWIADVLGALAGILLFLRMARTVGQT